jgi:nucleoside phosphorylase
MVPAKPHKDIMKPPVDFVIVTALEEERDAVLAKLPGYRQIPPSEEDVRVYFGCDLPATFSDGSVRSYRLVVVPLLNMGRVEAANAAGDAIRRWHPSYLLLIGIAGGVAEMGVSLGDILISDQIVDYELQKITDSGPEVRYSVHRADPRLLGAAKNYLSDAWLKLIISKRPRKGTPKRKVGPVSTGDKVIAFKDLLANYRDDWPKLIGVEMEAGGAASACFQAKTAPGFLMVRCVSDLADKQKDSATVGKWRPYACEVAAAYAIGLLQSGPVVPLDPQ